MTSRTAEEWAKLRDDGFANPSMCIDAVIENLAACEKERDDWKEVAEGRLLGVIDRAEKAEAERDGLRHRLLEISNRCLDAEAENTDLTLRLEQMRVPLKRIAVNYSLELLAGGHEIETCKCERCVDVRKARDLLSGSPGELAREVREVLADYKEYWDIYEGLSQGTIPQSGVVYTNKIARAAEASARIRLRGPALLAKMGGEG